MRPEKYIKKGGDGLSEDRRQKTEDRRQKTEDRRQGAQHVVSAECAIRGMVQIVRLILSGYLGT